MIEWVPVSERVPDTSRFVLVWEDGEACMARRMFEEWLLDGDYELRLDKVSHWAEINPPAEKERDA